MEKMPRDVQANGELSKTDTPPISSQSGVKNAKRKRRIFEETNQVHTNDDSNLDAASSGDESLHSGAGQARQKATKTTTSHQRLSGKETEARFVPATLNKEDETDEGMKKIHEHFMAISKRRKGTSSSAGLGKFSDLHPPLRVRGCPSSQHLIEKDQLLTMHVSRFERWWWEMEQGYSVLLQGFGSKSFLLDLFASCVSRLSANSHGSEKRFVEPLVCSIRGWSKQADLKRMVERLMRTWLEWDQSRIATEKRKAHGDWKLADRCATIVRHAESSRRSLVLVIHSLDGEALRSEQSQQALSCLGASPNVRLIASVDHVNAALLWSRRDAKRYNFLAHDVTTYIPYTLETNEFSHPAVSAQSSTTMTSATGVAYVLKSLTPTHNKILKELARRQLQSSPTDDEECAASEVDFQELFQHCLDMMWVTNVATLNQYLKEFQDHSIARIRMIDGKRLIAIQAPLDVIRKDILGQTASGNAS